MSAHTPGPWETRKFCKNCGVAMDVGGGCGICKQRKGAHTPGPWTVNAHFGGPFVTAAHAGYNPAATIAQCPHPVGNGNEYEREANARLIAAAPDLLAALRNASYEIHNPGAGRHNGIDIVAMIDAATAKAEGRPS